MPGAGLKIPAPSRIYLPRFRSNLDRPDLAAENSPKQQVESFEGRGCVSSKVVRLRQRSALEAVD